MTENGIELNRSYYDEILYTPGFSIESSVCRIGDTLLHQHDSLELIWVTRGEVHVDTIFEENVLKAEDFLLVEINDFHRIYSNTDNEVIITHINAGAVNKICGRRFPDFICEWIESNRSHGEKIDIIKEQILNLIHNRPEQHQADVTVDNIVRILLYNFNFMNYHNAGKSFSAAQETRLLEIENYLKKNYMKKIKLSDISRNANIDMTYLSHLFREISSFTFMEHLEYIRTNAALNLLLKSELPVSQIALESGFSDVKYLYRGFKNWFKQTPGSIRKKYRIQKTVLKKIEHLDENNIKLPEIIRTHKSSADLLKQYIRDDNVLSCYSEELRDKVTAEYLSGTRVTDIMSMYNLPRTTVYHWINDKKGTQVGITEYQSLLAENRRLKIEVAMLKKRLEEKE